MVVALDGPGGVGKSTVARAVAAAIGAAYLDTGAYYRAVTLAVLTAEGDPGDDAIPHIARAAEIDFVDGRIRLGGADVAEAVRSNEVTAGVSRVAAISEVREIVVGRQREWVARHGGEAVVEGRDIGTVVFPEASVKVFLTADAAVRARRRAADSEAAGMEVADIARDLERRDRIDSTRETSPLVPAEDAVVIDTTHLTVDEVAGIVLSLVALAGH